MKPYNCFCTAIIFSCIFTVAHCDVIPMIGGGQMGMGSAPMKHIDITFDGEQLLAHVDDSVATPALRELEDPNSFSSSAPWAFLQEMAYNFQYGWNAGGFISLPIGTSIWIENIESTPMLESYSRPPADPSWKPIFGTEESPTKWKWSGAMTHNVYAVLDPVETVYEATYRVYLGDPQSGEGVEGYAGSVVTLTWNATPSLPGDFDKDGFLTANDIDILTEAIVENSVDPIFDLTDDDEINNSDHQFWVGELKNTWIGDVNLDGEFNSNDLVQVFQFGLYELGEEASWGQGDWNADQLFDASDLVAAFQVGGYEIGPRSVSFSIPEPSSFPIALFVLLVGTMHRSRRLSV